MSTSPSVRLSGRITRAQERISSLLEGVHAEAGLVPTAAAATAARELIRSHPELIAHCGIFPTPEQGLQFEGRAWEVSFEVEIDRHGKLACSLYGPGETFVDNRSLSELEAGLDWTATVPRSEWRVLLDYDGPQAVEIAHPEGPAIALACAPGAEEGSDAEFLAVLPQHAARKALEEDLICMRALMMDPTSQLFLGRADLEALQLRPFHGDIEERMLPAEGLMFEDLYPEAAPAPAEAAQ